VKGTKRKLLEIYLKEVYRVGIANVSLLSLSKASKLSFGTVHYHLAKIDLFREALDYSDEDGRRYVSEGLGAYKSGSLLDHYIKVNFAWIRERPEHGTFWIYFLYESARNKRYAALNKNFSEQTIARVKELLLKDASVGGALSGREVQRLAEEIFQLLIGSMVFSLSQDMDRAKILKNCLHIKNALVAAYTDA
jgi:hypothetical protein